MQLFQSWVGHGRFTQGSSRTRDFAHSYQPASFDDQSVMDRVGNLHSGKLFEEAMENVDAEIEITMESGKPPIKMPPTKRRFIMSISFLASYFEGHARGLHDFRNDTEGKP